MADAGDSTEDSVAVPEAAICARRSAKEENKPQAHCPGLYVEGNSRRGPRLGRPFGQREWRATLDISVL